MELTVEEMGRTLRYFEWKRDWWLSLKPQHDNHDHLPDIQDGLRAYASRQSNLYDELIILFVVHWRTYLSNSSLGSSWLSKYALRDPAPVRSTPAPVQSTPNPRKADAGPGTTVVDLPTALKLLDKLEPFVDAPLNSGSDCDSEGDDIGLDAEGDVCPDAEDMFEDE